MPNDWRDTRPPGSEDDAPSWDTPFRARRDVIIEKFTQWLDETLVYEEPPEGIAAELLAVLEDSPLEEPPETCGEYELWAALTALTQEVKMQGRAFRDLTEAAEPLKMLAGKDGPSPIEAAIAALESSRADLEQSVRDAAHLAAWREIIDLLLDLQARLSRGVEGLSTAVAEMRAHLAHHRLPNWLPSVRRTVDQVFASMGGLEQGNALILERLEESLSRIGIHEIPAQGLPFDPATMKAVEVEIRDDLPEGTVCAVYQRGYTWRGAVYRTAEVKVSRHAKPDHGATAS